MCVAERPDVIFGVGTLHRESVALDAWLLRQLIPACNIIAGQVDYSPQAKTTLRPPVVSTTSPPLVAPLLSSLQLATGTSCKKHSNWTVSSPSLHSKTQSWTHLLTVVAASRDVLFPRGAEV